MTATIRKLPFDDNSLCILVRSVHLHTPLYFVLAFFYGSKTVSQLAFACFFVFLLSIVIFRACFFTLVEKQLEPGTDFVAIDYFLDIGGIEKTNANRLEISLIVFFIFFAVCFTISVKRHYVSMVNRNYQTLQN